MSFMASTMLAFSPKQLFAAGEKGVWYDPADLSTLFQDTAGTTPVTAVEQSVARINDKSGNGFNATQSTAGSQPKLSARVNLLTKTEQFDDAAWTLANVTVNANTTDTTDPLGGNTADKITSNATSGGHAVAVLPTSVANLAYTWSVRVKAGTSSYIYLRIHSNGTANHYITAIFDLSTGGTSASQTATGSSSGTITSSAKASLGNGWWQLTLTGSIGQTDTNVNFGFSNAASGVTLTTFGRPADFSGTTSDTFYAWGADLRVANDGVGLPAYQRVDTATSYATAGFPYYLAFDGSDDSLATGSIDFSSTDKMTVWAGVRKTSSTATYGIIVEMGNRLTTQAGSLSITAPGAAGEYYFALEGSTKTEYAATTFSEPITNILSCRFDIAGSTRADEMFPRVNGAVPTLTGSGSANAGTGNFGNYALSIGRRGTSSLPFAGRLYGFLMRGASSTTGQIADTERWLNGRAKAY